MGKPLIERPGCLWVGIGISIVVALGFFVGRQLVFDMFYAEFPSPIHPENKMVFVDGGFLDKDFLFYAKRSWHREKFVVRLQNDMIHHFGQAQWTKDGEIAVVSLQVSRSAIRGHWEENRFIVGPLAPEETDIMSATVIAFDFSAQKMIRPEWIAFEGREGQKQESKWKDFESQLKPLIEAHGGLDGQIISEKMIKEREKRLWLWNNPPLLLN